ncbi:MAG: histidine phosphatase family protein [Bacteroidota bacterium]|nr:histidine phosphatase family protein [Bacteroidota bacterium]
MKQLFIIRHAKSSWSLPGQDDFDRPLNDRGRRDAPMMAERLLAKKIDIDLIVSSPANRALTTAGFFADAYRLDKTHQKTVRSLYHASPSVFYEVIRSLDDGFQSVALFSHNPGITAFVNELSDARIDNMPTCGVFAIRSAIDHWKDFPKRDNQFWFFDYPKA